MTGTFVAWSIFATYQTMSEYCFGHVAFRHWLLQWWGIGNAINDHAKFRTYDRRKITYGTTNSEVLQWRQEAGIIGFQRWQSPTFIKGLVTPQDIFPLMYIDFSFARAPWCHTRLYCHGQWLSSHVWTSTYYIHVRSKAVMTAEDDWIWQNPNRALMSRLLRNKPIW